MADGSFQIEGRKVQRAYRLRCYPSRVQRQLLARHFGAARFVWNISLRARSEAYRDAELTGIATVRTGILMRGAASDLVRGKPRRSGRGGRQRFYRHGAAAETRAAANSLNS